MRKSAKNIKAPFEMKNKTKRYIEFSRVYSIPNTENIETIELSIKFDSLESTIEPSTPLRIGSNINIPKLSSKEDAIAKKKIR